MLLTKNDVIANYSKTLDLLDDYDHKTLKKVRGNKSEIVITYEDCLEIIEKLRFNNDSSLFALEIDKGLKSIIQDIYQSFEGNDLYQTIEEKVANFLYLNY